VPEGPAIDEVVLSTLDPKLERQFAEFFRQHRERSRRIAWRLVGGDDAAADDVVQDAFLRAYRALERYQEREKFEAWFYRILVRQAANYRRWRGLRRLWNVSFDADPPDPASTTTADPLLAKRLGGALDTLTSNQRLAFVLVHLEGLTTREAADVMQKATGTVKSHLQRALLHLRSELHDVRSTESSGERDE
jgi:RNA polymerase sigma-70 factor (ECF subfamily)